MTMTDEHKAQLATGREQSRVVRAYLEAIDAPRIQPVDRPKTEAKLAKVVAAMATASALDRLKLAQEKIDLEQVLANITTEDDATIEQLEEQFVAVAGEFSRRKGLTRPAWRAVKVPASVLKRAGI